MTATYIPIYYVLDDDKNVVCVGDDVRRWGEFFQDGERQVAIDDINEDVCISTVFLGIDHGIPMNPEHPILFETMVFRDGEGQECWRCATWNEALAQHKKAVELIKRGALKVINGGKP